MVMVTVMAMVSVRVKVGTGHNWIGTQGMWNTMGLDRVNRTGTHWDCYTMGLYRMYRAGTHWDCYIMGLYRMYRTGTHNGTGSYKQDRYTLGLLHNGTETQWDCSTL